MPFAIFCYGDHGYHELRGQAEAAAWGLVVDRFWQLEMMASVDPKSLRNI